MGAVYAGQQQEGLRKNVAIKVLHRDLSYDPRILDEALQRFRQEAEICSHLDHPYIIQVFDFGFAPDGAPFLVMEFLSGLDLEHRLAEVKDHRLEPPTVINIAKQTAAALQAAHDVGVVHRDLKPANIFLVQARNVTDHVKLLDFGISKVLYAKKSLTKTGSVFGTPNYVSPEQARGETGSINARTDQWALAAILWECLSGERLFDAENERAILVKVMTAELPPFTLKNVGPCAGIGGPLCKALSLNMEERYSSITEFVDYLDQGISNLIAAQNAPTVFARSHMRRPPTIQASPSLRDVGSPSSGPTPDDGPFRTPSTRRLLACVGCLLVAGAAAASYLYSNRPVTQATTPAPVVPDVGAAPLPPPKHEPSTPHPVTKQEPAPSQPPKSKDQRFATNPFVKVTDFSLQQHQVTVAEYRDFLVARGSPTGSIESPGENSSPATDVTRDDAQLYCESIGARLPTIMEWATAAHMNSISDLRTPHDEWMFNTNGGLPTYLRVVEAQNMKAEKAARDPINPLPPHSAPTLGFRCRL